MHFNYVVLDKVAQVASEISKTEVEDSLEGHIFSSR